MTNPYKNTIVPRLPVDDNGFRIQAFKPHAVYTLSITESPGDTATVEIEARVIRVVVVGGSTGVYLDITTDSATDVDTDSGIYIPPDLPEYFSFVGERHVVATAAAGGSATLQIAVMK